MPAARGRQVIDLLRSLGMSDAGIEAALVTELGLSAEEAAEAVRRHRSLVAA